MPRSKKGRKHLVRRILQEAFVALTVGTLFVVVPLHSKSNDGETSQLHISRITNNTGEIEMISTSRPESFVSWLSDQMGSLGQGDTY